MDNFEFACCIVNVVMRLLYVHRRWLIVLRRSVRMLASAWTAQHGIHQAKDVVSGWVVKVAYLS